MNSAVLIIGFNRPERLAAVIDRLRDAAPPRVYLAIDGPRDNSDAPRVLAAQNTVAAIDWTDQIFTRFRTINLGCQHGVIDAVTWFLDAESEGIIVEDDAVPDLSFFPFCDELLERYRGANDVNAICGVNLVPVDVVPQVTDYRLSIMGPSVAWATWEDRWCDFISHRFDTSPLTTFAKMYRHPPGGIVTAAHWAAMMIANKTSAMDSWAYPFMLFGIARGRFAITPNRNLIHHQGVGSESTHAQEQTALAQPAFQLAFPLRHPPQLELDPASEQWSETHEIGASLSNLMANAVKMIRRII